MEKVWEKTREIANQGIIIIEKNNKKYNNLPGLSFNGIGHVRPHGKNSKDVDILPNGEKITKQCFWLNATYIQKEVVLTKNNS